MNMFFFSQLSVVGLRHQVIYNQFKQSTRLDHLLVNMKQRDDVKERNQV